MPRTESCLALALALAFWAGCGGNTPDGGGQGDLATALPDLAVPGRVYTTEKVAGCGQGGYQTQLAVAADGTTFGLVTLEKTGTMGTCMPLMRPAMQVPAWNVCFAESAAGAPLASATVATENYTALTGVSLAYAPTGEAYVAYTGNAAGAAMPMFYCGSSNLLLAVGKRGVFGAPKTIATTSQSGGLVPDQKANCVQNVCNTGDVTGWWPAVAVGSDGNALLAWRDVHSAFATTDFDSADVEFAAGPGYSDLTVDVSRGGGTYMRIAAIEGGKAPRPAIVSWNGEREKSTDGIWLDEQGADGTWFSTRLSPASIGEMLGFAVSKAGLHAVAFYDSDALKLQYSESSDGQNWSTPTTVDADGIVGLYPSLAFGADGQPAIAYYRCRDYDPNNQSCDTETDGLRLARRDAGGTWKVETVSAQSGVFDGRYSALGFVGGKAVVAYQTLANDPRSGASTVGLDVAREQ